MITSFSNYAQCICKSPAFKTASANSNNYSTFFQLIFGVNAIQTATFLKIEKTDLARLQSVSINTGESLFVALLLKMLAFNNVNNSKLNIYKWGSNINNGILTHTLIIELFNQLIPFDTYEIPEPDNVVIPMNY